MAVESVKSYQGIATLGVNLNRQKYGPLDVSSVLLSKDDLNAYVAGDASAMSSGWTGGTPYPYPGQIIVVLDTNEVYQLYDNDGFVDSRLMFDLSVFYTRTELDEMLQNVSVDLTDYYTKTEVDNLLASFEPSVDVDLTNYYTKEEVDDLIGAIEGTEGTTVMTAMTEAEILAITGSYDGAVDSTTGQILTEMSAEDVQNIINQ